MENSQRPKNYFVESILVTLFCCLPLGIVGIINAANVNSRFDIGDVEGAQRASIEAKKWCKIGLIIGIIMFAGMIIFLLVFGGLSVMSGIQDLK